MHRPFCDSFHSGIHEQEYALAKTLQAAQAGKVAPSPRSPPEVGPELDSKTTISAVSALFLQESPGPAIIGVLGFDEQMQPKPIG